MSMFEQTFGKNHLLSLVLNKRLVNWRIKLIFYYQELILVVYASTENH